MLERGAADAAQRSGADPAKTFSGLRSASIDRVARNLVGKLAEGRVPNLDPSARACRNAGADEGACLGSRVRREGHVLRGLPRGPQELARPQAGTPAPQRRSSR